MYGDLYRRLVGVCSLHSLDDVQRQLHMSPTHLSPSVLTAREASLPRVPVLAESRNHVSGVWCTLLSYLTTNDYLVQTIRTSTIKKKHHHMSIDNGQFPSPMSSIRILPSIPQISQLSDILCLNLFKLLLGRIGALDYLDRSAYYANDRMSIGQQSMPIIESSSSVEER